MDSGHIERRAPEDPGHHAAVEEHAHPGPAEYIKVAIVLAVLTAIEIALYYITGLPDPAVVFLLMFLMVLKFALVALWFMHLRFDNRLFSRLFVTGLILAMVVFAIVLVTFGIFI